MENDVDAFQWCFCVSYVPLNFVTKVISYHILRCDDAIQTKIGKAMFKISMNAFSGYHQMKMAAALSSKIAFAGPDGRNYRYTVMSFGIVVGPTIFTVIIYNFKT